jgi:hypothetical protein
MSAACASSSAAATVRIRSPSACAASKVALPPIGIPRLAQVPPPYGTTAVSPDSTATSSSGTSSTSAMICASAVWVP